MFKVAAPIVISCVLFIQMGLSEAVQEKLHIRLRILTCPKCFTMWVSLFLLRYKGYGIIDAVAASFLCSYSALWLALLYDYLAGKYNRIYEQIIQTTDTPKRAKANGKPKARKPNEVS